MVINLTHSELGFVPRPVAINSDIGIRRPLSYSRCEPIPLLESKTLFPVHCDGSACKDTNSEMRNFGETHHLE